MSMSIPIRGITTKVVLHKNKKGYSLYCQAGYRFNELDLGQKDIHSRRDYCMHINIARRAIEQDVIMCVCWACRRDIVMYTLRKGATPDHLPADHPIFSLDTKGKA